MHYAVLASLEPQVDRQLSFMAQKTMIKAPTRILLAAFFDHAAQCGISAINVEIEIMLDHYVDKIFSI